MTTTPGATRVAERGDPALQGHKIKTSAAATFALVFGVSALICALTAILSPAAIVLGIIGVVLGIVGIAMSKRPHVTGKGVAIGGLVTALLGLLVSIGLIAGLATFLNNQSAVDRLENRVQDLRNELPTEVPSQVPGQ